ncbi:MAG: RNA polymerase sigma factor [Oscillospiraceae bacterium]
MEKQADETRTGAGALADAYADSVYRVALGYLRSPHDAEDAVQAVFCKLMEQKLSVYPGRGACIFDKS